MPEPVSKGLAASLTAGLIAYLGVDTVWSLIQGWRLLVAEADRATSFMPGSRSPLGDQDVILRWRSAKP